ncbi:MAG: DUF3592 domain-containing protein [Oscillospiraceae bacterium]|nr:DUF3592 domain-containing protein [Oscillospiraceae bacterium]
MGYVIGAIFALIGLGALISEIMLIKNGVEVTAKIVDTVEKPSPRRGGLPLVCPVVVYHVDGTEYKSEVASAGSSLTGFTVGSEVGVVYLRNNPNKVAFKKGKAGRLFTYVVLFLIGAAFILAEAGVIL